MKAPPRHCSALISGAGREAEAGGSPATPEGDGDSGTTPPDPTPDASPAPPPPGRDQGPGRAAEAANPTTRTPSRPPGRHLLPPQPHHQPPCAPRPRPSPASKRAWGGRRKPADWPHHCPALFKGPGGRRRPPAPRFPPILLPPSPISSFVSPAFTVPVPVPRRSAPLAPQPGPCPAPRRAQGRRRGPPFPHTPGGAQLPPLQPANIFGINAHLSSPTHHTRPSQPPGRPLAHGFHGPSGPRPRAPTGPTGEGSSPHGPRVRARVSLHGRPRRKHPGPPLLLCPPLCPSPFPHRSPISLLLPFPCVCEPGTRRGGH